MLETLTDGFRNVRLKFAGQRQITEEDISEAIRDIRVSLLEGDVEYGVVNSFIERVREHAKSATKVGSDKVLIEGSVFIFAPKSPPPHHRRHFDARRRSRRALERVSP